MTCFTKLMETTYRIDNSRISVTDAVDNHDGIPERTVTISNGDSYDEQTITMNEGEALTLLDILQEALAGSGFVRHNDEVLTR